MNETRKGLLRGLGILTAVLLAAGAISPAFSAAPLTKGKVRKIAKKVAKKQINALVPPMTIQETELVRWGPVTMNIGQADQVIGAFGPFTLSASCDQPGGAGTPERARVLIDTSEDNSAFDSNDDAEDDFDAADPPEEWAELTALTENVQDITSEDDGDAHAAAPSGTVIRGVGNTLITSFAGFDCWFAGTVFVTVPN